MWQGPGEGLNSSSINLGSPVALSHAIRSSLMSKPLHDFGPPQAEVAIWVACPGDRGIHYVHTAWLSVLQAPIIVWGNIHVQSSRHHQSIMRDLHLFESGYSHSNCSCDEHTRQ